MDTVVIYFPRHVSIIPVSLSEEIHKILCDILIEYTVHFFARKHKVIKVKVALERATKTQRGSGCIALLFLKLRRYLVVGGQRHAPAALPPGKTRYPLYRRLGGPLGRP